ncbi:phosphatidylinositol 3,4,5-trisphosphate 3-phosphatase TPTE2 isoform X4 [Hydra vulgaris]|uniref:Phosphatidylinositol 3,4,5-trisphosphate 3-phosphatase TPTE2 isoform X4 n=2 Tax=Hydra vulgaris TaxID=6087 RepID=A0ABM4D3R5_HYDVU
MVSSNFKVNFHKEKMTDEDILIFDDDDEWSFEDEDFKSTAKNQSTAMEDVGVVENDIFIDKTLNDSSEHRAHIWNLDTTSGRIRFKLHRIVDHIVSRIFSICLVLLDIIFVLIALITNNNANDKIYSYITLAIVIYFMVELAIRIFVWGREFFHHRLEIVDMVVIILSFLTAVIFEVITMDENAKYGKLVVAFRLVRILLLIRVFTGQKHVKKATRNLISQNKRRYVKDGFDLDLTYVTDRVIAMSFPSSGKTSLYRNPISEVARFFNTKHPGHYKIYNLCSERHYDTSYFHDNVERVLVDDHNVPRLSQLLQFCHSAFDWMKKDESNILVVHCKGGKGRTGTCVAAWLLFSGQFKSAEKALHYFGLRRTDKAKGERFQGVETPCQSRYVGYFEKILNDMKGHLPVPKPVVLKSLKITGIKGVGNGNGSDLRMEVIVNGHVIFELNFKVPISCKVSLKGSDTLVVKFNLDDFPVLSGDVKFKFHSSNPTVPKVYDNCAFFFWLHTSMIPNKKFHLARNEISNCHKSKTWKIYPKNFEITLKFVEKNNSSTDFYAKNTE